MVNEEIRVLIVKGDLIRQIAVVNIQDKGDDGKEIALNSTLKDPTRTRFTYHKDGHFHWMLDTPEDQEIQNSIMEGKGPPPEQFKGFMKTIFYHIPEDIENQDRYIEEWPDESSVLSIDIGNLNGGIHVVPYLFEVGYPIPALLPQIDRIDSEYAFGVYEKSDPWIGFVIWDGNLSEYSRLPEANFTPYADLFE